MTVDIVKKEDRKRVKSKYGYHHMRADQADLGAIACLGGINTPRRPLMALLSRGKGGRLVLRSRS
jgi:hypothetical protein